MGKTVVITGANSGIGKAVAIALAKDGWHVAAISRDSEKGRKAVEEIKAESGDDTVDLVQGDLSSIAGTRALAQHLLDRYLKIDVLVNNAGVWMTERKLNSDGVEMTFMVNHVAPFMLCHLLFDRLKESAPARIVNVNSGLYEKGEADLDALPTGKNFGRFKTYMHSKLCNMYFTMDFAKRIDGSGVTINAMHPGVIRTNLGNPSGPIGAMLNMAKRFLGPPEAGAKPVVRLVQDPALEHVSGKYFEIFNEKPLTRNARDPEVAHRLWRITSELSGCGA